MQAHQNSAMDDPIIQQQNSSQSEQAQVSVSHQSSNVNSAMSAMNTSSHPIITNPQGSLSPGLGPSQHSDGFILSSLSSPLAQLGSKPGQSPGNMTKAVSYSQYPPNTYSGSMYGKQTSHPPSAHPSHSTTNRNSFDKSSLPSPGPRTSRSKSGFVIQEENAKAGSPSAADLHKFTEMAGQMSNQNMSPVNNSSGDSISPVAQGQRRYSAGNDQDNGDQGQCVVQ